MKAGIDKVCNFIGKIFGQTPQAAISIHSAQLDCKHIEAMAARLRHPPLLGFARCAQGRILQELTGTCRSSMEHGNRSLCLPAANRRQLHTDNRGMLGTTVLCVRKDNKVIIIGDGQVTLGAEIIKPNVRKVRRLGANVIGGFAGGTADSFTLFERLETKLEEHSGQVLRVPWDLEHKFCLCELTRAAVELAKAWRTDKFLRRLDAVMVVADAEISLTITGNGDVLEPYDGVIGIGSGGAYASAAARALIDLPEFDAEAIARKAMKIAADCCIYTNHNFTIEHIDVAQTRSSEVEKQAAALSTSEEACPTTS